MASLIPNLGTPSADVSGAMRNYLMASQALNQAYQAPIDTINKLNAEAIEQKRYDQKMAMLNEEKMYNRGRDSRKDKLEDEERARLLNKELATNEALAATLNPEKFKLDKVLSEKAAMERSLSELSPEEANKIRSLYNPEQSGAQWLNVATNNRNINQGDILKARFDDMKLKLSDPNSAESKAAIAAEWDAKKRELDYRQALDMAKLRESRAYQDKDENALKDYYTDMLKRDVYNTVPSKEGIINQKDIDTFQKVVDTESANYLNLRDKYIKEAPKTRVEEKWVPGTSYKKSIEVPISEKEIIESADKKAYEETLAKINFGATPVPISGVLPETKVLKTPEEQINDKANILINSKLKGKDFKDAMEQIFPKPKSEKEQLEIKKIIADIEAKRAQQKKYEAEAKKNFSGNNVTVPNNIGDLVADKLGSSDYPAMLSDLQTIAKANKIPQDEVIKAIAKVNSITADRFNAKEGEFKDNVLRVLKEKYPIKE